MYLLFLSQTGLEPEEDDWCAQAKTLLLGFVKKVDLPNR